MRRSLAFLASTAAFAAACIPHPSDDFKEYEDKTLSMRQVAPQDASPPPDAAPPAQAVEGLYFGACFSQLAAGRTDRVLRFYTTTKFVPSAGGGALSLEITPLKLPAGAITDETFGKASTTGQAFAVKDAVVDSAGVFTATFGNVDVPGNANPISGREIKLENTVFKGRFADPKKFCTQLSAQVVQPVQQALDGPANICLFIEAKEGDKYLDPAKADYVCNVN